MKRIKSEAWSNSFILILLAVLGTGTANADQVADISFGAERSLSDHELSSQSGQGGGILTNATLTGNVMNVSGGSSLVNGNNVLGDHALDNVNGISAVIQNSGNNVIIQNSTVVNVNLQ